MDMFSAVLAVCFIILLYRKCTVMRIIAYIKKGVVTQPEKERVRRRGKIVRSAHFFDMLRKSVF